MQSGAFEMEAVLARAQLRQALRGMSNISTNELLQQTEREFRSTLGPDCKVISSNLVVPESYRGGFRIVLQWGRGEIVASYGDMEFAVTFGERELFGRAVHTGFSGNMFSREHLKEYLPRIVGSAVEQLGNTG